RRDPRRTHSTGQSQVSSSTPLHYPRESDCPPTFGIPMEREVLEFDVQWIGAGPAGLAGAIHLANLIEKHNASGAPPIPETTIAVLEKSATVGAHGISGAVMDPRAMRELMPDYKEQGCPIASDVTS